MTDECGGDDVCVYVCGGGGGGEVMWVRKRVICLVCERLHKLHSRVVKLCGDVLVCCHDLMRHCHSVHEAACPSLPVWHAGCCTNIINSKRKL